MDGKDSINPNLISKVFQIVLVNSATIENYNKVKNYYLNCTLMDRKLGALGTLGHIKNKALIQDCLSMLLSEQVRAQDVIYLLQGLGNNAEARKMTLDFVKENWEKLTLLLEGSLNLLGSCISRSCCYFSDDAIADDIQNCFSAKKEWKQISRSVEQTVEKIRNRAKWNKRDSNDVLNWATSK
eukprot:NODE_79_length_23048_cov_0.747614.p12 type:complete len:183 gc:universal NODE_79_length_23048_cov_0.747614:10746-11294(+)